MLGSTTNLASPIIQQNLIGEALDHAAVLVFVADEEMKYAAVNQYACDVLGYTRQEMLELRVTDVAVASDAPALYDGMIRRGAEAGVTVLRRKDGGLLNFRYSASEVRLTHLTFFVSVGTIDDPTPP